MSNLNRYQEIVIEAARAGGVDQLIVNIEKNAVAKATPAIVVRTVIVVGGGYFAARGVYRRYSRGRIAQQALADDAKLDLKATIEDECEPDAANDETSVEAAGASPELRIKSKSEESRDK